MSTARGKGKGKAREGGYGKGGGGGEAGEVEVEEDKGERAEGEEDKGERAEDAAGGGMDAIAEETAASVREKAAVRKVAGAAVDRVLGGGALRRLTGRLQVGLRKRPAKRGGGVSSDVDKTDYVVTGT